MEDVSKQWLYEHYIDKKLSIKQCAELLGRSYTYVRNRLLRYEIRIRPLTESQKLLGTRQEFRDKISLIVSSRLQDPNEREKLRIIQKKISDDPERMLAIQTKKSIAMRGRKLSEEHKLKISKAATERYKNPNEREKISKSKRGSKNAQWKGGISNNKYCYKFNRQLKENIRDVCSRTCSLCGRHEGERKLDVHHINFDKKSGCYGKKWNLTALCRNCHAWTTTHRWESFNILSTQWALNSDINFYEIYITNFNNIIWE